MDASHESAPGIGDKLEGSASCQPDTGGMRAGSAERLMRAKGSGLGGRQDVIVALVYRVVKDVGKFKGCSL